MSESLEVAIFDRLAALTRILKQKSVEFVDAVSVPEEFAEAPPQGYTDEVRKDESVDLGNEFLRILQNDKNTLISQRGRLLKACKDGRTDVPLENLVQTCVALHVSIENRIATICGRLGIPRLEAPLPNTIPVALFQAGARESSVALKSKTIAVPRPIFSSPKLSSKESQFFGEKDEMDLKRLGLSAETMRLLELESPARKYK